MKPVLSRTLSACAIALASCALLAAPAAEARAKKAAAVKQATPHEEAAAHDADAPDIANAEAIDYQCELGNKLTIYKNAQDDSFVALRWKNELHRMNRVGTTTGAQRFENPQWGLIWIGIPAKGLLLDSKHNHQLANECKTPEQMKASAVVDAGDAAPPQKTKS